LVKHFYLQSILRDVRGPTIDFGCGAGQLLARLPAGSVGFEVNPYLIDSLRNAGLSVRQARAEMVDFDLPQFDGGRFRTLVIAHVLEHLSDPASALLTLFAACRRLGIQRVIVVVPGRRGFASDRTHKTFVDQEYLVAKLPPGGEGFVRSKVNYFPGPWEWIGRYFAFHELKVVFDRRSGS
jgi:SAM-dependent methyltransferase